MDQRQTKIVEGAGLEESRLNTEFIDFLRKWSSPVLFLLAAVAGSYAAWQWWQRSQAQAYDQAYVEFEAALSAGSPDSLLAVAADHAGRGQVALRATLAAADVYLDAARSGVVPGGNAADESDIATPETIGVYLDRARELYGESIALAGGRRDSALHELRARFGLAATLATTGDVAGATRELEALRGAAERAGYPALAEQAQLRIVELERFETLAALPADDEVEASARPAPARVETPSSELNFRNEPVGPLPPPGEGDGG